MTSTTTRNLRTTAFRDLAGLCIAHAGRPTTVLPTATCTRRQPGLDVTRSHSESHSGDEDDIEQFRVVRSTRTHARDVLGSGTGARGSRLALRAWHKSPGRVRSAGPCHVYGV